ncbi:Probable cobalt transporter subunit (CbtA) [Sinosporangium album]|uniref:Probable cobalt transporter subunit (CbtA) n=1 Tax=Sinosporangium album TaxID=504805 RepID=A0A1G8I5Y8_9ACTN|nr:CbtA family protein [Sinosporangium album]SDI14385.1 Probable cobalt transporter subunit (CbtA) [Sinosporangium album]
MSQLSARWTAAGAAFLVPVAAARLLLPTVDEVPAGFPATLLWDLRLASLDTQAVLWLAIGGLYGSAALRADRRTPIPAPA